MQESCGPDTTPQISSSGTTGSSSGPGIVGDILDQSRSREIVPKAPKRRASPRSLNNEPPPKKLHLQRSLADNNAQDFLLAWDDCVPHRPLTDLVVSQEPSMRRQHDSTTKAGTPADPIDIDLLPDQPLTAVVIAPPKARRNLVHQSKERLILPSQSDLPPTASSDGSRQKGVTEDDIPDLPLAHIQIPAAPGRRSPNLSADPVSHPTTAPTVLINCRQSPRVLSNQAEGNYIPSGDGVPEQPLTALVIPDVPKIQRTIVDSGPTQSDVSGPSQSLPTDFTMRDLIDGRIGTNFASDEKLLIRERGRKGTSNRILLPIELISLPQML